MSRKPCCICCEWCLIREGEVVGESNIVCTVDNESVRKYSRCHLKDGPPIQEKE